MKKVISLLLVLAMCACLLISCGDTEEKPSQEPESKPTEASTPSEESTPAGSESLQSAYEFLEAMYYERPATTAANYSVTGVLRVGTESFTIVWSANVAETEVKVVVVDESNVTIEVNGKTPVDIPYELKATISDANGNTIEKVFNYTIPAYVESGWEDYVKACKENDGVTSITVTAYVTGIVAAPTSSSKGSIWLQDASGKGYYAFAPVLDSTVTATREAMVKEFPIGTEVTVSGTVTTYGGCFEFNKGCSVVKTGKTAADNNVKLDYVDATADFGAASGNQDAEKLDKYQSCKVTLKGVTMEKPDGAYYYFTINGVKYNVYKNNYILDDDQAAALFEKWEEGGKADITGIVNVYSKSFQIYPDSADSIKPIAVELTDAERVAGAKERLELKEEYNENFELPTSGTYETVIAWALKDNTTAVKLEDNKVTLATDKDVKVIFVATISYNGVTDTKELTANIVIPSTDMIEAEVLEQAFALAQDAALKGKQVLRGEITKINTAYSTEYKNITVTIKVGEKEIQCFRLKGEGAEALAVGDVITVTGIIKNYKGTVEFDSGCTFSKTLTVDEAKQLVVTENAFALETDAALKGKQVLRGEITKINTAYSTEYKNITVTIKVGEKEIQCFRLKGEGAEALAVGDVITVTGIIKNYKGTVEFDSGCTFSKTLTIGEAKQLVVVEEAFALAQDAALKGKKQLTGEITKINTAYSTEYKNITVTIKVGEKEIQCFRLKGEGAEALAVGDVITVTGIIKNYKGTVEFDSGCTFIK